MARMQKLAMKPATIDGFALETPLIAGIGGDFHVTSGGGAVRLIGGLKVSGLPQCPPQAG